MRILRNERLALVRISSELEAEVHKSKGYIARAEGQAQALKSVQEPGLLSSLDS